MTLWLDSIPLTLGNGQIMQWDKADNPECNDFRATYTNKKFSLSRSA